MDGAGEFRFPGDYDAYLRSSPLGIFVNRLTNFAETAGTNFAETAETKGIGPCFKNPTHLADTVTRKDVFVFEPDPANELRRGV